MRVDVASATDAPEVLRCYDWLFAPPGGLPPSWDPTSALGRLTSLLDDVSSVVLVVRESARITGFCTIVLDLRSVRYGQRAWVEDLAVDPASRSRGTGKALLDAARTWAVEHGATHLELDSGDARLDAHRFYDREEPSWTSRCFGWQLPASSSTPAPR